jgi:cell division protein FtsQ
VNAKTTIRKVLFVTVWLCIGAGMLTLLLAAISKKNKGRCKDYSITIKGVQDNLFIDKNDVEQLLKKAVNGNIKGQPIASFNLDQLEQMLKHNTWINEAELYFDNRDVLHVAVKEKEPVARIFTVAGNSFYIDSLGRKIPLSDKLSARVPVFTGFPEKKVLTAKDSLLLNDVRVTANFIVNDPFWMAQVAQVDITEDQTFEMTPVVGNHTVKLGNGENIDTKFHRLFVFYQQVLSKTGFDKYKTIDVQYKGQVVVSKQSGNVKVDSVLLRRNVEKLLRQSIEAQNDTVIKAMPVIVTERTMLVDDDSSNAFVPAIKLPAENKPNEHNSPNPLKPLSQSNPPEKKITKPKPLEPKKSVPVKENNPKPVEKKKDAKAVMPKKITEDANGGYN